MIATLSPNGRNAQREGAGPPTRLLVGTLRGVHLFERDRPGAPWRDRGRTLDGSHCGSLMVAPDGGVFAGMHTGGLYHSADGGETWERRMSGITVEHVYSLNGRRRRDGTIELFAGTEPVSLFRSTDGGASWHELSAIAQMPGREKWCFPGPPQIPHLKGITFDPGDESVVYAWVEQGGLMKSTDGGHTWSEIASYARDDDYVYHDIHLLVVMPSRPSELFMTGGCGLYHTTDGGGTWEHLTDRTFRIGYPDGLIVSPLDENTLFMSGALHDPSDWRKSHQARSTIMRSRDRARTWEAADRGLPDNDRANFEAMSLFGYPGGFALFAGNTDGQVVVSEDGAEHWELLGSAAAPVSKGGHFRNLQLANA